MKTLILTSLVGVFVGLLAACASNEPLSAADDSGVKCVRESSTASAIARDRCTTAAEREQQREAAKTTSATIRGASRTVDKTGQ